jgi:hypothetical protein
MGGWGLTSFDLQQDYDFPDDAPARVPDEGAVFVQGFVEGWPGDCDDEVEEPVYGGYEAHS